jgi:fatty aldehyde decarbonylase
MLSPHHPSYARVHSIILSQAITGESVGIEHYARMIPLAADLDERLRLLEDAWRERQHLESMREVAGELGVRAEEARADPYWSRVKGAFADCAARGDLLGCYVIQDVVLECFAVTLYESLAPCVEPFIAARLERIAADERGHLAEGMRLVRAAYNRDPDGALARIQSANERVARVLGEWIKPQNCAPVCGVCGSAGGGCAKPDLELLQLNMSRVQSTFVARYGAVLREIGVPTGQVTRWLARLFD